jgi:transcriptional regulator with XRE-family HTH domain
MKLNTTNTNHEKQFKLLGRFFREFRFNYGLTQIELSENTHVHRRTIQRLESGENITIESLMKIADFFEMDLIKDLTGIKTE